MNKKKISIALMAAMIVLPALKTLDLPGIGLLLLLSFGIFALAFLGMGVILYVGWENDCDIEENQKSEKGKADACATNKSSLLKAIFYWFRKKKEEIQEATDISRIVEQQTATNKLVFVETMLFYGLSILSIGILFTVMHYPGAQAQRTIGGAAVILAGLANVALLNSERCSYHKQLRSVSAVAVLFAAFSMYGSYWGFIFKKQYSDYHHLVSVYEFNRKNDPEGQREQQLELAKFYDLDSKSYNHFDSLLTKANAMAAETDSARVLYLLMNYTDKHGDKIPETVYDYEAEFGMTEPLGRFAQTKNDIFQSDTKLLVVTNDPEAATEKLKSLSAENKEIIIVE